MYYKLYRRRQYIYLGIFLASVLFLISQNTQTNDDGNGPPQQKINIKNIKSNDREKVDPGQVDDQGDIKVGNKRPRVNMKNYIEPPICKGCPGENGAGVYLNVTYF